jgi:hypothetical protein
MRRPYGLCVLWAICLLNPLSIAFGLEQDARLVVDEESLRLLHNSLYASTVVSLLDGAETRLLEAERLGNAAKRAETEGQIGQAMSMYWQAVDACDTALELLQPVGTAARTYQSLRGAPIQSVRHRPSTFGNSLFGHRQV